MNVALLIVEGGDAELVEVRKLLPTDPVPDQSWKKGDILRSGNPREKSGFSIEIADSETPRDMERAILQYIAACRDRMEGFKQSGVSAWLSIGFSVGDSQQFAAGVDFAAEDLCLMSALGIDLSIMAYPTSDEANADEGDT